MSGLEFDCTHRFRGGFALQAAFHTTHRVTALFGPSGGGKTSILSMIAGFLHPQSGRIRLGPGGAMLVDTARRIALPPERRGVGFVFQDHLLFPHLTVEANLRYGAQRLGRRECRELDRVVAVLELGGLLARYPRGLSGGEAQRVALGRALMSGPELLLLDEPLTALDEALRLRVLDYLERVLKEWNIPTLFVSHAKDDVRRLAEWVVVLREGRVVAQGPPDSALG